MQIFRNDILLSGCHLVGFSVVSLTNQNATSQVNLSARNIYEEAWTAFPIAFMSLQSLINEETAPKIY